MAPGKDATEFNSIIQAGRDKKKHQDLANKIFSRRSSAPAAGAIGGRKPPAGPSSLASRITKPGQPSKPARNADPIAKVQTAAQLRRSTSTPQLSNNARRNQALDAAFNGRGPRGPALQNQINIRSNGASRNADVGFTIKGSARREWAIGAQNFAPGTTAQDIASVFVPNPERVGFLGCEILLSTPTVIAQLTFDNKQAADDVIAKYNNKKADNRLLYVYHQPEAQEQYIPTQPRAAVGLASRTGGSVPISSDDMDVEVRRPRYQEPYTPPRPQRAQPDVQDGRYGFSANNVYPSQSQYQSGLVSDSMIGRQGNRRANGGGGGGGRLFH